MPAPYDSGLHARIADLNRRRLPRHSPQDAMIRDLVSQRATDACEYCLMPTHGKFEVEHIVPEARWLEYLAKQYPGLHPAERLNLPDHDHINNFAWLRLVPRKPLGISGGSRDRMERHPG